MYKDSNVFLKKRYDPVNNRTIDYYKDAPSRVSGVLSQVHKVTVPTKVLDVGCYDGHIGMLLKEKMGAQCVVYGIDAADNCVAESRKKGIKAKKCDITKGINYPSNSFDIVFAGEIIEHVLDSDFFMRELKRVLKPNGTLIFTTPNSLSLGRRLNYLFGNGVFLEISYTIPKNAAGHIHYFTFSTMKEFASMHKFEILSLYSDTVNFPTFRSDMLAKYFPTLGQSIIVFLRNKK